MKTGLSARRFTGSAVLLVGWLLACGGCQTRTDGPSATPPSPPADTADAAAPVDSGQGEDAGGGFGPEGRYEKPTARAQSYRPGYSFLDRSNEAYPLLQRPGQAMSGFPLDATGAVDWVATLAEGHIRPRAERYSAAGMERRFDVILMKETREMPWVRFPDAEHTEWLACSNCHPKPFVERVGANDITMDSIFSGRDCGMCHDRVAFSVMQCERCHNVLHAGSPVRWW